MRVRRGIAILLTGTTLLSLSAWSVVAAAPAQAALACPNPNPSNITLVGAQSGFSLSYWGARAYIDYRDPDLCGTDSTSSGVSVVWSMITENGNSFAQAGYGQFGPASYYGTTYRINGIYAFDEWTYACYETNSCGAGSPLFSFSAFPMTFSSSSPYAYTAKYVTDDDRIHMYANGTYLDETSYDPTTIWQGSWQGEFFGETHDTASDIVGTATTKTNLGQIGWSNEAGTFSPFASLSGTIAGAGSPRYHTDKYTDGSGNPADLIWTDPAN